MSSGGGALKIPRGPYRAAARLFVFLRKKALKSFCTWTKERQVYWTSFKTTYCRHPELDSGSGQIPGRARNDV